MSSQVSLLSVITVNVCSRGTVSSSIEMLLPSPILLALSNVHKHLVSEASMLETQQWSLLVLCIRTETFTMVSLHFSFSRKWKSSLFLLSFYLFFAFWSGLPWSPSPKKKKKKKELPNFLDVMQVLKGHIALGNARFPNGTNGSYSFILVYLASTNLEIDAFEFASENYAHQLLPLYRSCPRHSC